MYTKHKCVAQEVVPNSAFVEKLMAARNAEDNDTNEKVPGTTPHVNMFLASACLDNSI